MPKKPKVLSPGQVEQFIEEGYTILRGAYAPATAAAIREVLWREMGLSPDEPAGWTKPVIEVNKWLTGQPFSDVYTERLWGAYDDLMGEGRYRRGDMGLGWFTISFPGYDRPPWRPADAGIDWHIDGNHFRRHLNSREQGLLPLFILSQIQSQGGGTTLAVESHKWAARLLAESEPGGMEVDDLMALIRARHPLDRIVELTGEPGDVALTHPFILHTRSTNLGRLVRFISNPCMVLNEPMNLDRPDPADYSPVERSILGAFEP